MHIVCTTENITYFVQFLATILLAPHQSEALPHLKLAVLKAKLAAIKAPHIVAHVAVATDVKHKTADAFWKSLAAIKATKLAAASIVTAPVRVVAKTIALKVAALKAAKALKVAKVGRVVDALKRNPLIVPVPVPVRIPFPVLPQETIAPFSGLLSGAHGLLHKSHVATPPIVPVTRPVGASVNDLLNQLNVDFKYPAAATSQSGHLTYGLPSVSH